MIYVFLIIMILLNFNWIFKKGKWKQVVSREYYVSGIKSIIGEIVDSCSTVPDDIMRKTFKVAAGLSVILNGTMAIIGMCVVKNILLLPFVIIVIFGDLMEYKYLHIVMNRESTLAEDTIVHCILVYRRVFFMLLTISVALAIF